jgi:hypothetical protein
MQHVSVRPGATFFVPDTEGVKIHQNVAPADGEQVIRKHFPNSFRDTALLEHLRGTGVQELVIAGMIRDHARRIGSGIQVLSGPRCVRHARPRFRRPEDRGGAGALLVPVGAQWRICDGAGSAGARELELERGARPCLRAALQVGSVRKRLSSPRCSQP